MRGRRTERKRSNKKEEELCNGNFYSQPLVLDEEVSVDRLTTLRKRKKKRERKKEREKEREKERKKEEVGIFCGEKILRSIDFQRWE